jgi:hypothetical protein
MGRPAVHTIRLELVRHGPPHNQLLSPLTPYLALCNNQGAETVHVPMEHAEHLDRLVGLVQAQERAGLGAQAPELGRHVVAQQARDMTALFGSLRSLQSEMAGSGEGARMIHVRLVLAAWELAALPFEMASAPAFFPGAGAPLLLGADPAVVITRETRRVSSSRVAWPDRPRILLAHTSLPGEPVPHAAHRRAIDGALRPWIGWASADGEDGDAEAREISSHLTVLRRASVRRLEQACRKAQYTHVHLLAHGGPMPGEPAHRARYGVRLHGRAKDEVDHVDGARLAAALDPASAGRTPPAVVTLATCDGGHVGSAIAGGGSLAHALHDAGVPLVVASQLPLTKAGSTIMAATLYEGFLRGEDPRETLCRLRRTLFARLPHALDWASIVAYGRIADDIEPSLERVATTRLGKEGDVTLRRAAAELRRSLARAAGEPDDRRERDGFDEVIARLFERRGVVADAAEIDGPIASLLMRWTEERLEAAGLMDRLDEALARDDEAGAGRAAGPFRPVDAPLAQVLRVAAERYAAVYDRRPERLWALAGDLVIRRCLGGRAGEVTREEVTMLERLAERALAGADPCIERHDARFSLAVALLLGLRHRSAAEQDRGRARIEALALEAIAEVGAYGLTAFSHRRVLRRLACWLPAEDGAARRIAGEIHDALGRLGVAGAWRER